MAEDARRIDLVWTQLLLEPPSAESAFRTRDLEVVTPAGAAAAAVDADGNRHLLIPLARNQRQRTKLDGANLRLGEIALEDADVYQRYADIQCVNRRLDDLFSELCTDVVAAIAERPSSALAAANQVLADWRALFAPPSHRLTDAQLAGIFGELLTLRDLLQRSPSSFTAWLGPSGHRHDFAAGVHAVEVKTTLHKESRTIRIHGLDQLDPPEAGSLYLRFIRLTSDPAAQSIVELADQVLSLSDNQPAVINLLAQAGYVLGEHSEYADRRFTVIEDELHPVDDEFPRLTEHDLPEGSQHRIHDVDYSIDLPEPNAALDVAAAAAVFDNLTREALR